ncbi:MAG: hypothetical protein ACQEQV_04885 [Fibrobacterota bacterium]
MMINAEIIGLITLSSVTIVGYMIALNARGMARIALSFLMATLLLGGTVFAVVQYINSSNTEKADAHQAQTLQEKAELERKLLAQKLENQQLALEKEEKEKRLKMIEKRKKEADRLLSLISEVEQLARSLSDVRLSDRRYGYSQLVAQAEKFQNSVSRVETRFDEMKGDLSFFANIGPDIAAAIEDLNTAARFYRLYYSAESTYQERTRKREMEKHRRSARERLTHLESVITGSISN